VNSSEKEKAIFRDLLIKSIDGQITQEEVEQFNTLMAAYPDLEDYYIQCVQMQFALRDIRIFNIGDQPDYENQAFWKALADAENGAPAVEITPPQEPNRLIQKVQYQKVERKISKGLLFTLCATAAAVVLIFVFAYFITPATGIEVAVLSDSINAKWSDSAGSIPMGSRLSTGYTPMVLQEGIVELSFDTTAKVVIEAPAEFYLLTADQIKLNYGKLYAVVPQLAIGFSVNTPNSRVIDLGTEFGVQTRSDGSTQLHVIKGKINLLAGITNKIAMEVLQGKAKNVSGSTSQVHDIPVNETEFVRSIDSKQGMIWRGQKQIHLADIVGGGNGLGTGKLDMGIDPISGKPTNQTWESGRRQSTNDYRPVATGPYIDGVFIPNGQTPQIVSSQGHLFRECPVTDGSSNQNFKAFTNYDSLVLENFSDKKNQTPYLYLHANMGITFDLNAMRRSLPGVHIDRFQSQCGIRKYANHPSASNADFWVLVDGKVRFKKEQVKTGEIHSVDIELSENDHFLTLVETDGGDPASRIVDGQAVPATESDWGMFVNPILVLE
jgi:hypothetical protein